MLVFWYCVYTFLERTGVRGDVIRIDEIDVHEWWRHGPGQRFTSALLRDLPESLLEDLQKCKILSKGDFAFSRKQHPPRVWIVVNGEHNSGEDIWRRISQIAPRDRYLILGNWWNESLADHRETRVSSFWVPLASIHFAQLQHTPADLLRVIPVEGRGGAVAYQHRNCRPQREHVWDSVNEVLMRNGMRGTALGRCNGEKDLGQREASLMTQPLDIANHERSIERFSSFRFVMAQEHSTTAGYVSEKMLSALLAGAIPIYSGTLHADDIFNQHRFLRFEGNFSVQADRLVSLLQNSTELAAFSRQPAVNDEQLRRHFSWHPSIWKTHGDFLRMRIVNELLALCTEARGVENQGGQVAENRDLAQPVPVDINENGDILTCSRSHGPVSGTTDGICMLRRRVFVMIFTRVSSSTRRAQLREAWFAQAHGLDTMGRRCDLQVGGRFFVGRTSHLEVDDVISVDVVEGYHTLAKKLLLSIAWAVEHEPSDYIIKVDDDVFIHPPSLLSSLPSGVQKRVYLGVPRVALVDRSPRSNVGVAEDLYAPSIWPVFNQGIHYLISADIAVWLASNREMLRSVGGSAPEDVSMAIWLLSLDILPQLAPWMFNVNAGVWLDGVGPESEVSRGCHCDLAVVGLDSSFDLPGEMMRLRGAFERGTCPCKELMPRWLLHEARRLMKVGANWCDVLKVSTRVLVECDGSNVPANQGTTRCTPTFMHQLLPVLSIAAESCEENKP